MIELQNMGTTYSVVDPTIYDRFKSDGDAEIFENLVMDLMLNKYSEDKELTEYILGLPKTKQRMAVLSVIDGDNVLWSKMNAYVNECSDKFEHIKDVVKIINQFVKDGEVEKKKFGEVMTPISLVREMLDTLPEDVWSNPNLKWLDPANGAGTFPFVVIYKLMNGLKDWEPDTEKRYKHIVEKMIYVCELQSRNVFLWLCGVDPKDEYTTNTYWGSFLEPGFDKHMKEVWSVDKFDIVIGNPPYNDVVSDSGNAKDLFDKFILKSMDISNKSLMITPSRWFTKKSLNKLRDVMIPRLELINHFPDASILFTNTEITGGVSYFILGEKVDSTIFDGDVVSLKDQINEFGMILYDQRDYINIRSLISRVKKMPKIKNFNPKGYFGIKSNQVDIGQVLCYYSDQRGKKENMNLKNGRYFSYVSKKDIKDIRCVISDWKVMTSSAYGANPRGLGKLDIIEPNEICNESFVFFNFSTKKECENFKKYLESDIIKFLISIKKNKQDVTSDVFSFIPNLDFNREYNRSDIIDILNLSKLELSIIENNI